MKKETAISLKDLLDRLETAAASPSGAPADVFRTIAKRVASDAFSLPDQGAWDEVQSRLEKFAAGEDYGLSKGAVDVLASVAVRKTPLLEKGRRNFTPQVRAVSALAAAFKSQHQMVQVTAARVMAIYGTSDSGVARFAADALRQGFGVKDSFVRQSVLTAFARVAAKAGGAQDLKPYIPGLEAGLQNPSVAGPVAQDLMKIARHGPEEAAIVINLIDRAFLTPDLGHDVYDEGVKALAKIGVLNKTSAVRAIAALEDLDPLWQASRNGRAGVTGAIAEIALAQPTVTEQAIDALFKVLPSAFEDNDAWVQMEAVDAVVAIAVGLPAHEADIRSRLDELARDSYGDIKEMTARALKGIEPARKSVRMQQELIAMADALGSGGVPSP